MNVRRGIRTLAVLALLASALAAAYFFVLVPRYAVPILMYHRFGYEKNSLFVTPEDFESQMRYLSRKNYRVAGLDELADALKEKRSLGRRAVAITIDDGYDDFYRYAYPVLKKYGFKATVFVITDYIGTKSGFLGWDELLEMSRNGIQVGGHTRTHFYLPEAAGDGVLRDEIGGCKAAIEAHGIPAAYFSYPAGGFTARAKEIVRETGFLAACTTNRGFARDGEDLFELRRIKTTRADASTPIVFAAKLSGYYNLFRSRKAGA